MRVCCLGHICALGSLLSVKQITAATGARLAPQLPSNSASPSSQSLVSAMATTMIPPGAWTVVSGVVFGILLLCTMLSSYKYKNLPPGPRGLPFIGSLHLLSKFPHKDLSKLAKKYGPLMSIWLGPNLAIVATSREAAEEILKRQGSNFSSRHKMLFGEVVLPRDISMMPDSPVRLHLKKVLHTQLGTSKQVQLSANIRAEEIALIVREIPQDGITVVHVRKYVEVAIANIISRLVLKKRVMAMTSKNNKEAGEVDLVNQFREIVADISKTVKSINLGDFIPIFKWLNIFGLERQLQKLRVRMEDFMSKIVLEHVEQRKRSVTRIKDMVDTFLDQMEDGTSQFTITDVNMTSTLWDAFVGGTDTTTDTSEWALAECIRNPMVMKKAQEELDTIVGKSRRVEDVDIPNLKYLQAIVKETFRLHPVGPLLLPHLNEQACKVWGYDIPKKTSVIVNVAAIAQDATIWEDPMTFKPERFLDGMPHAHVRFDGQNPEMLPFGAGRRQCPGILLASTLVHIMVATLIQSFDWCLPDGLQPADLRLLEAPGIGHTLAHPLMAIPKARLSIP